MSWVCIRHVTGLNVLSQDLSRSPLGRRFIVHHVCIRPPCVPNYPAKGQDWSSATC